MPGAITATLRRFDEPDALASAAADELIAIAIDAVAARGACRIALSGGSTPKRLFQQLAARGRAAAPWDQIELWWGDERTVAPDHPDSNYRMTREALIEPLALAAAQVHRIVGEDDPDAAARTYEAALIGALGAPPVFDLVLLGMGPDGHTASLFPGSPALAERDRWVVANPVDSPLTKGPAVRITLTVPALAAARHTRFLVTGADKATTLAGVLGGPPGHYPSQRITGADVVWLIDAAAGGALP
jgi:6-phosphogluconolactonase